MTHTTLSTATQQWPDDSTSAVAHPPFPAYDGTLKSLADRPRSGRLCILSVAQVKTSIIDAVRSYRRKHRCVSYATLLPADGSLAVPPNGAEKRQDNWTHQKQANKEANEE
jgi:hypothetical protein